MGLWTLSKLLREVICKKGADDVIAIAMVALDVNFGLSKFQIIVLN